MKKVIGERINGKESLKIQVDKTVYRFRKMDGIWEKGGWMKLIENYVRRIKND